MTTDRSAYIQSLHDLGHLLHDIPALPLPHGITGYDHTISWYCQRDLAEALAIAAVMDNPVVTRTNSVPFPVQVAGTIAGLAATVEVAARLAYAADVSPAKTPLVPALAALTDAVLPVSA